MHNQATPMDWFSWLSRSSLEPSLTYEYGLAFTRNELEKEDLVYFNHEFLKSLGINVAKHRLEILKLVKKETQNGFSKLVLAFNKTKKLFTRRKWGFHTKSSDSSGRPPMTPSDTRLYPAPVGGAKALRRFSSSKDDVIKPANMITRKNVMKSGPLDRRMMQPENNNRTLSISGPLDGKLQDRWMLANWSPMRSSTANDGKGRDNRFAFAPRSPTISISPCDGRGLSPMLNHYYEGKLVDDNGPSLWSLMFQDLKPT